MPESDGSRAGASPLSSSCALPYGDVAVGIANGVLGELWQGPVDECVSVISLPMERASRAIATRSSHVIDPTLNMTPLRKAAFRLFEERFGLPGSANYTWSFDTELITGQGMASSTADIVALIRCLARIRKISLEDEDIINILAKLKRSDPVFRIPVTLYKTAEHEIVEEFPRALHLWSCFAVTGPPIPTGGPLDDRILSCYRHHARQYQSSLNRIREGLRSGDVLRVLDEASASAMLAQNYLPNPFLERLYTDLDFLNAGAVSRAHTGSLVGLLFDRPLGTDERQFLSEYFSSNGYTAQFTKVGSHAF